MARIVAQLFRKDSGGTSPIGTFEVKMPAGMDMAIKMGARMMPGSESVIAKLSGSMVVLQSQSDPELSIELTVTEFEV